MSAFSHSDLGGFYSFSVEREVKWQARWMKFRWETEDTPSEGVAGDLDGVSEGVEESFCGK